MSDFIDYLAKLGFIAVLFSIAALLAAFSWKVVSGGH